MKLAATPPLQVPVDGRQSETALAIARGAARDRQRGFRLAAVDRYLQRRGGGEFHGVTLTLWRMILSENRFPLFGIRRGHPRETRRRARRGWPRSPRAR